MAHDWERTHRVVHPSHPFRIPQPLGGTGVLEQVQEMTADRFLQFLPAERHETAGPGDAP